MRPIRQLFVISFLLFLSLNNGLGQGKMKLDPRSASVNAKFIGTVVFARGKITKSFGKGETERVQKNSKVYSKDVLETAVKSIAKIKMNDGSMISLGPKSKMNFKKYKETGKEKVSVYGFVQGKIRAYFPPEKAKSKSIKVETKTVSMGIRGTKIAANIAKNKFGKEVTEVALVTGSLDVLNRYNSKKYPMVPGKHFVSIEGKDEYSFDEALMDLSPTEFLKLKSMDELENGVVPIFLDGFKGKLSKNSSGNQRSTSSYSGNEYESESGDRGVNGRKNNKKWKKTLNKLNNTLKDNRDYE